METKEIFGIIFVCSLIGCLIGLLIGVNITTLTIKENEYISYQTGIFYIHHVDKKEVNKEDHIYELTLRCYQKGESK
jgi:hypothetical protein